ncbi:MAG: SRPBCC family protein [Burkholderiales bacterium]|nr:SRPBCC family protein [Burkholderiales bacterium]
MVVSRASIRLLALSLLVAVGAASAHGPTRQKVVEQVTIAAPPDQVWALVGGFDALERWHPAVASSKADHGNDEGSVRDVQFKNGRSLSEKIEGYDGAGMKVRIRAKDGGALPVTNYTSQISVTAADGGGSVVEWRGAFYRGYPRNDPPPDQTDEVAVAAVTEFYRSGLAGLKALAEHH